MIILGNAGGAFSVMQRVPHGDRRINMITLIGMNHPRERQAMATFENRPR